MVYSPTTRARIIRMMTKTNSVDLHIGAQLKHLMLAHQCHRSDIAAVLGISEADVKAIEEGQRRLSAAELFEITRRLPVGVTAFFDGLPHVPRKPGD